MSDVLITGASGGMGRAAAVRFRDAGYRVFAIDICPPDGEAEENIIPIEADITSEESLLSALATVREYTDSLSAIVHFAGIYMLDSLVEMESEELSRIVSVNFLGAVAVNRIFLPLLSRGSKIIITTSELAPLDPLPFTGIYAVTKAALDKYAYSLRMELQLLGISVSVIRAGAVDTGMLGVSCEALDRFVGKTRLYSCNAKKFKSIVERVEARCVLPEKIARLAYKILDKSKPRFAYNINRNPLLRLLNLLPKRLQLFVIRCVLR